MSHFVSGFQTSLLANEQGEFDILGSCVALKDATCWYSPTFLWLPHQNTATSALCFFYFPVTLQKCCSSFLRLSFQSQSFCPASPSSFPLLLTSMVKTIQFHLAHSCTFCLCRHASRLTLNSFPVLILSSFIQFISSGWTPPHLFSQFYSPRHPAWTWTTSLAPPPFSPIQGHFAHFFLSIQSNPHKHPQLLSLSLLPQSLLPPSPYAFWASFLATLPRPCLPSSNILTEGLLLCFSPFCILVGVFCHPVVNAKPKSRGSGCQCRCSHTGRTQQPKCSLCRGSAAQPQRVAPGNRAAKI